jgi:glutathione S-transferase
MKDLAKEVDSELKGKNWLVGKNFSAADLFVGTFFSLVM